MKRVYFYVVGAIVAIILAVLLFVTIKPKKVKMENEKFELLQQHLEIIESEVIDLTSPHALKRVDEFDLLVEAHKDTIDVSLICQYLGDKSKSDMHKEILIYSLVEAPFDSYVKIFECCVNLYKKKKVSNYLIWTMVLPAWDDFGNFSLIENYRDERLRKIITENKKKLPVEMGEVLEGLLSGLLWEAIEQDRELNRIHESVQY